MSISLGEQVVTTGRWSALARLNPVTKLVVTVVITVGLLLSYDRTTAGVILAGELLALPFVGLSTREIAARGGFLVVIAAVLTLVNALFSGNADGTVLLDLGPFVLSTGGLLAASAIGLRVLALSLPAVLLLATADPARLSDGLQQHAHVPARYALSMVVGLRVLPLLASDWREISAARRARGLVGRGPVSAATSAAGRVVGLLVAALRRAVRLALAMQARGFDPYAPRTRARTSVFKLADLAALLVTVTLVGLATALAVAKDQWRFSLSWPF